MQLSIYLPEKVDLPRTYNVNLKLVSYKKRYFLTLFIQFSLNSNSHKYFTVH